MKWIADISVGFLLASCLISTMVNSQGGDVECPSECDAEKCQCSEAEAGGLFVICDGLTESFINCIAVNVIEFQLHNSELTSIGPGDFRSETRLDTLDITGNFKLETIEEFAFRDLKNLRRIYLDGNALKTLDKEIFPKEAALEIIRLNNNNIELVRHEAVFAGLHNSLTELQLGFNKLEEFICPKLLRLTKLDLSENRLKRLPREMFRECPELVEINLSTNHIVDLKTNWTYLRRLHFLDLNGNEIVEVEKEFPESLPHLRYLFLGVNELRSVPPLPRNLLGLDLSGNRLETIHNRTFENHTQLTFLDISQSPYLESIEDFAFAGLRSLDRLVLNNNRRLGALPESPWPDSRDIQELRLDGNNISIFHRSLFDNLDSLWWADINENPIHCSCDISWIRVEMDNEENHWIKWWMNGTRAVTCWTPDNLFGFDISQLNPHDLTCTVSRIEEHSQTETSDGVILQAWLVEGVPSTSWYFPDGRRVFAQRQEATEGQLQGDPKVEEILFSNLTILARLTLANSDSYRHGKYILEFTNAAGTDNFTFTVGDPPPQGGGSHAAAIAVTILSIVMVALFIVGGVFLYRYLRSRQLANPEPLEEDPETMATSDAQIQNEAGSSSLLTPATGYGSIA